MDFSRQEYWSGLPFSSPLQSQSQRERDALSILLQWGLKILVCLFLCCNSKPKLMILKQMFSTNRKTFLFNHWTGCHHLTSVSWVDWFFKSSVISDMCSENLHCYWMISQFMGNKIRLPMYQPIQSFIPVLSGDILKYL